MILITFIIFLVFVAFLMCLLPNHKNEYDRIKEDEEQMRYLEKYNRRKRER